MRIEPVSVMLSVISDWNCQRPMRTPSAGRLVFCSDDRRRDVADLVHGVESGGAGDEPRAQPSISRARVSRGDARFPGDGANTNAALFLASDESRYANGAKFLRDGWVSAA
jgi:hypothetical protein